MPTRRTVHPLALLIAVLSLARTPTSIQIPAADWPAFGRDHTRNAVSPETNAPADWDLKSGRNIKWKADIASVAFGAPAVADGLVWIGGNNWRPGQRDLSDAAVLYCFDERTGEKVYEYVSPRLGLSYINDPGWHGLGSTPLIEGDRLWFVTNRCETVCLDIAPLKQQPRGVPRVVWKVDFREKFGVHPFQAIMGPNRLCSLAPSLRGLIFVSTCNGVDPSHTNLPAPNAPALICFDLSTGEARWQAPSGPNVLHSESASPLVADIAGRGQVIMPHGDGWLRAYDPLTGAVHWEFDINPKQSLYRLAGRSDRNYFLSTPVLYEDRIYIASGRETEMGEGPGRLVCIDPKRSGDISSELGVDADGNALPRRRFQAVDPRQGERAIPNPNSGLVWEYSRKDWDGDGKTAFEEEMHRTLSSVVIQKGLLLAVDFSGLLHCLDARTGLRHWAFDPLAGIWAAPLIVDGRIYVVTEDNRVLVFRLSADPAVAMPKGNPLADIDMGTSICTPPVIANGTLYVTTRNTLYAIQSPPPP